MHTSYSALGSGHEAHASWPAETDWIVVNYYFILHKVVTSINISCHCCFSPSLFIYIVFILQQYYIINQQSQ